MKCLFAGYRDYVFNEKESDKEVSGTSVWLLNQNNDNVKGFDCLTKYNIPSSQVSLIDKIHHISIGSYVNADFDINFATQKIRLASIDKVQ